MIMKMKRYYLWMVLLLAAGPAFGEPVDDPCSNFLSLVNRPNAADSPCTIPNGHFDMEMGYQYQNNYPTGQGYNLPQANVRIGLPGNNELGLLMNYNHQNISPSSGWNAPQVGLKHEIGYNDTWLEAVEGYITLPTGSAAFGSQSVGGTVNGIVTYSMNSAVSATLMLGLSSLTNPNFSGGQRYTSINPYVVFSWQITEDKNLYAEVFGQTRSGPNQGSSFSSDVGFLYLLKKNLAVDVSVGQRISGLSSFRNYIGAGFSFLI